MPKNEIRANKFNAIIIDPKTNKLLAKVCLNGDPFPTNEWVSTSGNLQNFEILDEKKGLWEVWVHQSNVILRTEHGQRVVKITTYPTDGENHGLLNFISDVKEYQNIHTQSETQPQSKKKITFLRTIFGA